MPDERDKQRKTEKADLTERAEKFEALIAKERAKERPDEAGIARWESKRDRYREVLKGYA